MTTRFEESLQVSIDVPEEHLGYMIPPLSVQLLIENAIKHNMISAEHPLHISIKTDNTPALIVSNNLQLKKIAEESTKTGLNNITERYKLLVHKPIHIINDGTNFKVILPLLNT
jgi:LytS/YehU family sensor histidine kinase